MVCIAERRRARARKPPKQICGMKIWEEIEKVRDKDMKFDVRHLKAHRIKKEKAKMAIFEKFVTDGNEQQIAWRWKEQIISCHVDHWDDCDELKPKLKNWTSVFKKERER